MIKTEEITEILPGKGLGILKFGMTRDQVKLIMGNPDEEEETHTDGITDEDMVTWHYDQYELSMEFSESTEYRMISIATSAEYVRMKTRELVNKTREELLQIMSDLELEEQVVCFTDEDSGTEVLYLDDLDVNFYLEDNTVSEIQWTPRISEEEEIIWPEM